MRKYAAIALCTSAILAGCNTNNVSPEPKKRKRLKGLRNKERLCKNKVKSHIIQLHTNLQTQVFILQT